MAQRLLASVEDEARSRRDKVQSEIKEVRAEAYASGLAEGLARVSEATAQSATSRLEVLEELTPRLIALVRDLAQQVICHELTTSPASIATRVTKALKLLKQDIQYELRIHPSRSGYLSPDSKVVPDSSLRPDEFVIRGNFGKIYSSPARHLETLVAQISF